MKDTGDKKELVEKINSVDFYLMFKYESSASFIGPDSRGYAFEIYANTNKDQMLFKEYKPSAWEIQDGDTERFNYDSKLYKKHLRWHNTFKIGEIADTHSVLNEAKEFIKPIKLKEIQVFDGAYNNLEIRIGKRKKRYYWNMLEEESYFFEEGIRKIIRIAKGLKKINKNMGV
ncbi:MAG: hypothetical protein L6407_00965 [Candidatus Delongbacteria bacterium]|nr:hypothetical protein [Candidatus Delongbacteria bacterium]